MPVYYNAKNTEPTSPTRIAAIGERLYTYTSSFITTVAQAQEVANNFLKVHALEQFEISLESIVIPWLEVGESTHRAANGPSAGSAISRDASPTWVSRRPMCGRSCTVR